MNTTELRTLRICFLYGLDQQSIYPKTYKELITGMLNSLLYVRGDAEKSGCKTDRNINKQMNIVTIFI